MAYFGLSEPESLCRLVRRFEGSGKFPAQTAVSKWSWLSWKDSTVQLIGRVRYHTSTTKPLLTGPASDTDVLGCR